MDDLEALRYPVGRFVRPELYSREQRSAAIEIVRSLPAKLTSTAGNLDSALLDTPYREGGWTVRQVVHHIADSHINAYCRFKLALTEEIPTIKPYTESRWAELHDSTALPVDSSLSIIHGLHERWVDLMESMTEEQWQRKFHHPQYNTTSSLELTLELYAWHSRHHLAHILLVVKH